MATIVSDSTKLRDIVNLKLGEKETDVSVGESIKKIDVSGKVLCILCNALSDMSHFSVLASDFTINGFDGTVFIFEIENFENNSESQSVKSSCNRKYRLPKLELKKFNGNIKSFLGFWSQFSRIHEDEEIPSEEKFQYLIQAITPGTRAASLIETFQPTAQNYPKAIELLKERFGREDLSKEKYDDFLSPLVESCLPEYVLRAWKRHRGSSILNNDAEFPENSQRSLENPMAFLRQEVNGEEMINLARSGFGCQGKVKREVVNSKRTGIPSASALISATQGRIKCDFCSNFHPSQDCEKDLAREFRLLPSGKETLSQGLFGGNQTPEAEHYLYTINVERIDGKFSCQVSVLDQPKICPTLPRVRDKHLLAELENHCIVLTDIGEETPPIRLLLGLMYLEEFYREESKC
ncbi:hypothetical protein AVEN_92253-1 [Araneus ventricosus]|uniref:Uncharacterized protein n=1 Tax=Araneus ventricosus TaxID=182803 RepID=A0A4Y2AKG1_ARAVE|nr:hypothetical protein AVEN_92253-1 [Araneus ventricosus]